MGPPHEEILRSLFAVDRKLDPATINLHTDLLDIGLDSFQLIAIISQVEARYDIQLSSEEVTRVYEADTIGDIAQIIELALTRRN